jgi:MIP family channel proteins
MKIQSTFYKATAEAIGTFSIVFAGCGAMMVAERFPGSIPLYAVPISFGLAVTIMVYSLGHISGAHFNPAVTAAFSIARHFPAAQVAVYWLAQVLGAFGAISLLSLLLPAGRIFGATFPSVSPFQAVLWEAALTFFLMFVITAVATDARVEGKIAGISIGSAVAIGALVGGPVTGASMNPARSLAPAIFENRLDVIWIYLIGPFLGAIPAALIYGWIRCDENRKAKARGCC